MTIFWLLYNNNNNDNNNHQTRPTLRARISGAGGNIGTERDISPLLGDVVAGVVAVAEGVVLLPLNFFLILFLCLVVFLFLLFVF